MLLYGPPGSGKSQLVRVLARALGISLRQVPDVDITGNVLKGEERLASLSTMQYLLQVHLKAPEWEDLQLDESFRTS